MDELERACTAATKDAQQHEAQVSSLHRQLREAQVTVRNAEKEAATVCAHMLLAPGVFQIVFRL